MYTILWCTYQKSIHVTLINFCLKWIIIFIKAPKTLRFFLSPSKLCFSQYYPKTFPTKPRRLQSTLNNLPKLLSSCKTLQKGSLAAGVPYYMSTSISSLFSLGLIFWFFSYSHCFVGVLWQRLKVWRVTWDCGGKFWGLTWKTKFRIV